MLMDESDLCKTAGSPAFFAPELCYQGGGSVGGGMGSFPSFGGSSLPSPTTFGGAAEEMFMGGGGGGGLPSSAPMSSGMLAVPPSESAGSGVGTPQRAPSSASASSSSHSHGQQQQPPPPPAQQQPPKERSNRPKFLPSRQHSSNSSKTAPITIPTSPSTPTGVVASPTTTPSLAAGGNNPPPVTAAIDIWALGVTLYCLLFGKPPFNAPTEFVLYKIIPNEDFVVPERMGKDQKKTGGRWGARDARRRRARKGSVVTTGAAGGGGVAGMLAMNGRSNSMGVGGVKEDGGAVKDKDDEQEGYEVVEILERLLEKDPTKRITLHDLKVRFFCTKDRSKAIW